MWVFATLLGMAALGAALWDTGPEPEDDSDDTPEDDGLITDQIIPGSDIADFLEGGAGNAQLIGYGGADTLGGYDGNDVLIGHDGADALYGGLGEDRLEGGDDDDTLFGGEDADLLLGGLDADWRSGEVGEDTLFGGLGADQLFGGEGADFVSGYHGNDTITGGLGADDFSGGSGHDVLIGTALNAQGEDIDVGDTLVGGQGNDILIAGAGDLIEGISGADQAIVSHWNAGGNAALWADFDDTEDRVAFYDETGTLDPARLTVTADASDPTIGHVMLDGETILTVVGGGALKPADISIVTSLPA